VATTTVQTALTRAASALERGRGAEAVQVLLPYHRSGSLPRDEELSVRARMAEAYLLQDDLTQAAAALGRPPDVSKEPLPEARLSTLWRLHGRLAFERSEQERAIALQTRALKFAELAHDSRLIGLARYELAMCYKRVGDSGIVREHLTEASNALHAAGDKRHLALAHRLLQSVSVDLRHAGEHCNDSPLATWIHIHTHITDRQHGHGSPGREFPLTPRGQVGRVDQR